jgi:hypothetical protein
VKRRCSSQREENKAHKLAEGAVRLLHSVRSLYVSAAQRIGVNRLATALTGCDPADTVCRQAALKVN